jgi:hypothetical protein
VGAVELRACGVGNESIQGSAPVKNHPGHFWICFWLALILLFGTSDLTRSLDRVADTLVRIETKLDTLRERLP